MINKIRNFIKENPIKIAGIAGLYLQGCVILSAAFSIPIILNTLGEDRSGIWLSLLGFISILALSDFGFSMAISRQVAHSFKLNLDIDHINTDLIKTSTGWAGVSDIYWASRNIFKYCSILALIAGVFLMEIILPNTKLFLFSSADIRFIFYPLVISSVVMLNSKLSQAMLDGLGYMYLSKAILGCYQLILGLFCIISLKLGFGIIGLSSAYLIASIIQLIFIDLCLRRVSKGRINNDHAANLEKLGIKISQVAIPFGIVITGAYLVSSAQIPLLGSILGPAVVTGMYLAFKISQTLSGIVMQIISADLPFFTQNLAEGGWVKAKNQMIRTIIVGSILQIFISLFLFFGSPTIVEWWVGPNKYISGPVLIMFCVNYFISSITLIPAQFVLAEGRNPFAISTVINGGLSLLVMLITCNAFGLIGVPLASLIAILLTNFWLNPYEAYITLRGLEGKVRAKLPENNFINNGI